MKNDDHGTYVTRIIDTKDNDINILGIIPKNSVIVVEVFFVNVSNDNVHLFGSDGEKPLSIVLKEIYIIY